MHSISTEVLPLSCFTTSHRLRSQTPMPFSFNPRLRAIIRSVKRYEGCRWLRMRLLVNPHYQKSQLRSSYPPSLTRGRKFSSRRGAIKRMDHRESDGSKNHVKSVRSMIMRRTEKAGTSERTVYTTCRAILKRRTANKVPGSQLDIVLRDAIIQQYIMSQMTWKTRARRRHIVCGFW